MKDVLIQTFLTFLILGGFFFIAGFAASTDDEVSQKEVHTFLNVLGKVCCCVSAIVLVAAILARVWGL